MRETKSEKEIFKKAISALQKQIGLTAIDFEPTKNGKKNHDFILAIHPMQTDLPLIFPAEVKRSVNSAVIGEAALKVRNGEPKLLLVTEYISQPQAENLRGLNVMFLDTAGNAYLNQPGLYVFVSGKKTEKPKERIPRLFRAPGMKILFALLTDEKLLERSYRTIASETGVPTPTVGVFMNDLETAGFLIKRKSGARRLLRQNELFRRWVENYGEGFRRTLNPVRFSSQKYDGRWWEKVDIRKYDACWGGETGGAILTKHLKPEIATIYAESLLPRLQLEYGLVRDAHGNVEILNKFWAKNEIGKANKDEDEIKDANKEGKEIEKRAESNMVTAPPLVIYADLIATADERNLETAQIIYEKYLVETAERAAR